MGTPHVFPHGFEPQPPGSKQGVLPLHHRKIKPASAGLEPATVIHQIEPLLPNSGNQPVVEITGLEPVTVTV